MSALGPYLRNEKHRLGQDLRNWVSTALLGASLILSLGGLVGCSHDTLTLGVRDRNRLGAAEIRELQLYTSADIVLRRASKSFKTDLSQHELRHGTAKVEEIYIPKGTPGVALIVEECHILVSFSAKDKENTAIWFSVRRHTSDWARADATYSLSHLEAVKGLPLVDKKGRRFRPTRSSCAEPDPVTGAVVAKASVMKTAAQSAASGPTKGIKLGDHTRFALKFAPAGFTVMYGGKRYNITDSDMWHVHLVYDEVEAKLEVERTSPGGFELDDSPNQASLKAGVGTDGDDEQLAVAADSDDEQSDLAEVDDESASSEVPASATSPANTTGKTRKR